MGLYRQPRSPFWWMFLEPTKRWASTKIAHTGSSAARTRELREMAQHVYETEVIAARRGQLSLVAKESIAFSALAAWYQTHVAKLKRGAEREGWAIAALVSHFGSRPVHTIDGQAILEWRAARAADVAPGTVTRELDVLRAIFAAGIPRYLAASPIPAMTKLRRQRGTLKTSTAPRILTRTEESKLEAVMTRPVDLALFRLALCTLGRLSDLLDLRWQDVGSAIYLGDPKAGKPYSVPLARKAKAALAQLPKRGVYVFPHHRRGTAAERRNRIKMWLKRKCERAGVKYGRTKGGITFHSFRHTGASRLLEQGVDVRTVQEIGGWSSLRMLERYTHPTPAQKRRAVERI
jgi:integrase